MLFLSGIMGFCHSFAGPAAAREREPADTGERGWWRLCQWGAAGGGAEHRAVFALAAAGRP